MAKCYDYVVNAWMRLRPIIEDDGISLDDLTEYLVQGSYQVLKAELDDESQGEDQLTASLELQVTFAESQMLGDDEPTDAALEELSANLTIYLSADYQVDELSIEDGFPLGGGDEDEEDEEDEEDVTTNSEQGGHEDYTEYEPEDGCFAAPRGKVPAAKKKPAIRRIKGASGDLYDPTSKANRLSLDLLADRLREIGFLVECHQDETTLRVYPTKRWQYPLLNPEFCCDPFATEEPSEYLRIVALSRGDESKRGTMHCARGTLHKYLVTFTDTSACYYVSYEARGKLYYHHGTFYLPLHFTKAKEIDFKALGKPLRKLWQFLNDLPASKSKRLV